VAHRDEILAFADELLDLASFPDYGPMGVQVVGADEVTKVACGVSASRELFARATAAGAQLVLVHHGLFWDRESRVVDALMRGRLKALFDAHITLAAYHLALDAHPEIGNNVLLANELGVEVERPFATIGVGGRLSKPLTVETFVGEVRSTLGSDPLAFLEGSTTVERVAIVSGGGAQYLVNAAREEYDLLLTGEADEPTMMRARELGIHFLAAGHYATETLGVQALATRLAERFGLDWQFIDLPNPV
jgi:dinuclear metal center YbgI/SA1388 family protein